MSPTNYECSDFRPNLAKNKSPTGLDAWRFVWFHENRLTSYKKAIS